jgi:hypothetical protein
MKVDEVIALYIEKRDEKTALKKVYDDACEDINVLLKKIENKFLEQFLKTGQDSTSTGAGTAFTKQRTSDKVIDREAFLQFVKDNDAFDFIESKCNKTALDQFIEEKKDLPPGVTRTSETIVQIRRGKG